MTIFLVEDDAVIREMQTYALSEAGYEVISFAEPLSFHQALSHQRPDLIILDIMLPHEDGLSVLSKIKKNAATKSIPVMFVTARTTELDRVKGLDAGADDYLVKPFGIMEFLSRVKALLRRSATQAKEEYLVLGPLEVDVLKHTATLEGHPCDLTYKEFELLRVLVSSPGIVFSRQQLMEQIWGVDFSMMETRTVDMHIKTLRKKLKPHGSIIKTIRNVGYKADESYE